MRHVQCEKASTLFGSLYWLFFFAFAHLAWAACRAESARCSFVSFFARA